MSHNGKRLHWAYDFIALMVPSMLSCKFCSDAHICDASVQFSALAVMAASINLAVKK